MEFSSTVPLGVFSGGRADDLVLPNELKYYLHDCMESIVTDAYSQSEGCPSPDTDDSIENVTSFLDEIGDIPNYIDSVLNDGDFNLDQISIKETVTERPSQLVFTSSLEGKSAIANEQFLYAPSPPEQKPIENKEFSRRKQKIVPIYEKLTAPVTHIPQIDLKHESICVDGDEFLDNIMRDTVVEETITQMAWSHNSILKSKEEPKKRRKRGLSNVEKRDRKKESNRNASFRYRQRKKQQQVDFLTYSQTLNEQLDTAKRGYFHAAEELLRYIKHANLIRAVKDECSKLVLE